MSRVMPSPSSGLRSFSVSLRPALGGGGSSSIELEAPRRARARDGLAAVDILARARRHFWIGVLFATLADPRADRPEWDFARDALSRRVAASRARHRASLGRAYGAVARRGRRCAHGARVGR